MRRLFIVMGLLVLLSLAPAYVMAETYNIVKDNNCGQSGSAWSFDGFRQKDGAYLSMVLGRVPLPEVSKYGIEAYYLPDSRQLYHPFFVKFGDRLVCSPATEGEPYDAVLTWTAPESGNANIKGQVKFDGSLNGSSTPDDKVAVKLAGAGEPLWSGTLSGGGPKEFSAALKVSKGDKLRLHVANDAGRNNKITSIEMQVEVSK